jgi:hypothetical protein
LRIAFFLLLLVNAGFFAWSYFGTGSASSETQLIDQQVNPQAIRLLSAEQVAALAAERTKQTAEHARPAPPSKTTVAECLELGPFNLADVLRVEQALEPLGLGARLAQRRTDEVASYWVFMPPQGSRQAANRKSAELRKLGVEDFFILQEDHNLKFAISLGVFKTEDAAKARLGDLRAKGVRSAQVGSRETTVQKVHFIVRDVPDALTPKLNDVRRGFPGSELKGCPPEEKRAGT